jgi:enterochelin esterase-like enzyme
MLEMEKRNTQNVKRLSVSILALFAWLSACVPVTPVVTPSASPRPLYTPSPSLPLSLSPSPLPLFSPSATAAPDCQAQPGTLEPVSIPTTHLHVPLRFLVYLPPCYATHAGEHYPVLYLFHGLFYDETQWVHVGVISAADRLVAAGEIMPFLIVLPYDPSGKEPDQYGFADAITGDLLPYVDSHYRTLADAAHRAAGGLSRGGGWVVHFGLSRPDLFGTIGAHSPALFWADTPHYDDWLPAIPPEALPRLWIDVGDNDRGLASVQSFEAFLNDHDVPHEFHLYQGYHDEAYWQAHVEEYLRWYAAGWEQ